MRNLNQAAMNSIVYNIRIEMSWWKNLTFNALGEGIAYKVELPARIFVYKIIYYRRFGHSLPTIFEVQLLCHRCPCNEYVIFFTGTGLQGTELLWLLDSLAAHLTPYERESTLQVGF